MLLNNIRQTGLLFVFLLAVTSSFAQPFFSISSDIGVQRNFKKEQHYWAVGHSTQAVFHITRKEAVTVSFAYFSNGKFKNELTATAKSLATLPQQIDYTNRSKMGLKQFSIGYRNYFRGGPDIEEGWSLYGGVGLGIEFGRVQNTHSIYIDTSQYNVPVRAGSAHFKRLSLDLSLGWERPLSGDLYFYMEARGWIPTTDYPSKYIFINQDAPIIGMLSGGIRILF